MAERTRMSVDYKSHGGELENTYYEVPSADSAECRSTERWAPNAVRIESSLEPM